MASKESVWCCSRCGAALAIARGKRIIVHERHASYFVTGQVVAVCRCLERNELGGKS